MSCHTNDCPNLSCHNVTCHTVTCDIVTVSTMLSCCLPGIMHVIQHKQSVIRHSTLLPCCLLLWRGSCRRPLPWQGYTRWVLTCYPCCCTGLMEGCKMGSREMSSWGEGMLVGVSTLCLLFGWLGNTFLGCFLPLHSHAAVRQQTVCIGKYCKGDACRSVA